jgi:hypothetical protein
MMEVGGDKVGSAGADVDHKPHCGTRSRASRVRPVRNRAAGRHASQAGRFF